MADCVALQSIDLRGMTGLKRIGEKAFVGCDALTSINLSGLNELAEIGAGFGKECPSLQSIDLSGCRNEEQLRKQVALALYRVTK